VAINMRLVGDTVTHMLSIGESHAPGIRLARSHFKRKTPPRNRHKAILPKGLTQMHHL
jgi:hypothetical protein